MVRQKIRERVEKCVLAAAENIRLKVEFASDQIGFQPRFNATIRPRSRPGGFNFSVGEHLPSSIWQGMLGGGSDVFDERIVQFSLDRTLEAVLVAYAPDPEIDDRVIVRLIAGGEVPKLMDPGPLEWDEPGIPTSEISSWAEQCVANALRELNSF
jgi:hypothetical protein